MRKQLFLILAIAICINAFAQFQTSGLPVPPPTTYRYGEITTGTAATNVRSIGIGNFSTIGGGLTPQSRLHVNEFFFPAPNTATTFLNGQLFRTDGNIAVDNMWRLYTGANAGSVLEKFRISSLANSNIISLSAVQNGAMLFQTNSIQRLYLNNSATQTGNNSGYLGVGPGFTGGVYVPISKVHVNGLNNLTAGVPFQSIHPNWTNIGYMATEHSDEFYIGMKDEQGTTGQINRSDAVLARGNDDYSNFGSIPLQNQSGPDYMRFIFYGGGASGMTANGGREREVMRLSPWGNVGIGQNFNEFFAPNSNLHIHDTLAYSVWAQFSNQGVGSRAGTAYGGKRALPSDGLRIGILGDSLNTNSLKNGNACIYNQENRHLLLSTGKKTPHDISDTEERIRLTYIMAPTFLPGGSYGIFNPANFSGNDTNITRVSISHQPATPVIRPLSLLHLGYDPSAFFAPNNGGWRPWMDIGTYTSGLVDHLYVGLKDEGGPALLPSLRMDAVINWGRDNDTTVSVGPDNMRFIFTKSNVPTPPAVGAGSLNGIEGIRLTPAINDSAVYTGIGGDPALNKYYLNSINPTLTLEVNSPALADSALYSGMRFTDMTSKVAPFTNPGKGVLGLDSTGRVIYVEGGSGFGNLCANPSSPLPNNFEVPMGGFNYSFTGFGQANANAVHIGNTCGINFPAKLFVIQQPSSLLPFPAAIASATYSGYFLNRDWKPGGSGFQMFYGVAGQSQDILSNISSGRTGVYGIAQGAKYDYGVKGEAKTATNGYQVGGVFQTLSPVNNSSFSAGVYAKSPAALNSWAFYGNGSVLFNGGMLLPSDEAIKHEITPITNAMSVINQLNPVSFKYDTAFANTKGLNLAGEKNYGFTANEIQEILPELVYDVKKPDDLDTTGAVVSPEYAYKAMNYIPLIGILTAGIQEQQLSIDSLRNTSGSAAASNGLSVSSGNTVLGNNLGLTSAQLTNDREIPLNNKRLFFSDAGATSGLNNGIKIGGAGIGILEAKLDVTNASFGNGLNILTTTTSAGATNHGIITNCSGSSISNYAIEGTANDAASPANIGVRGNARNASGAGALNYGGDFEAFGNASGSSTNIGVSALATPANGVSNTGSNYGGRFKAQQGSIENYGMYAEAQYGSGNNYGVYATAVGGASNYAGYFNGDVTRTGSDNFTSDAMFKTNLDSISDALSIINSLKPRKFNYDTANTYGINFSSKKQYGFVAQDVQTVLPELIGSATHPATRDSAGNVISPAVTYKTLNYQAFSAIAIKAIQELKKENSHKDSALTSMQNQIDQLATLINSCCSNNVRTTSNTEVTYTDVELSDKDAITLSQNAPNPFAEHTLIQYNIPQDRGFAQIIFSDLKGQIIKVIDIKTKGKGQLNVFASDLSSGMYTYSLYVDGKLFETKKMLKTQ